MALVAVSGAIPIYLFPSFRLIDEHLRFGNWLLASVTCCRPPRKPPGPPVLGARCAGPCFLAVLSIFHGYSSFLFLILALVFVLVLNVITIIVT